MTIHDQVLFSKAIHLAKDVQSLLVEGGACLLQSFIDADLWDEVHVETAPFLLKNGVQAPILPICLDKKVENVGGNKKEVYMNNKV